MFNGMRSLMPLRPSISPGKSRTQGFQFQHYDDEKSVKNSFFQRMIGPLILTLKLIFENPLAGFEIIEFDAA